MSETKSGASGHHSGVNRAKLYQLALFPMNNGATNVYFVLILSYVAQFGSSVLQLGMFSERIATLSLAPMPKLESILEMLSQQSLNWEYVYFWPPLANSDAVLLAYAEVAKS